MTHPCRRHDAALWDEESDQWVCQKCGFRWAVRRKPDGRPFPRQVPVDAKGTLLPRPTMPDRWIGR